MERESCLNYRVKNFVMRGVDLHINMVKPAMKLKLVCLVVILVLQTGSLLSNSSKLFYTYYISSNMSAWKSSMDSLALISEGNEAKFELLNYQYGYIAWAIGNELNEEAEAYIKKVEVAIEELEASKYELSSINAYKTAIAGFKIGLHKYYAPILGPKSFDYSEESLKLDSLNWIAHAQKANLKYYSPEIVGGSKAEGLKYYLKTKALIESQGLAVHNWNYLNVLTSIAIACDELDRPKVAKKYYEYILKLEPNYKWVKDELYPELLKKLEKL